MKYIKIIKYFLEYKYKLIVNIIKIIFIKTTPTNRIRRAKMNEYKVQLESREDLAFLKDEFMKYYNENCADSGSEVSKQQVNFKKKTFTYINIFIIFKYFESVFSIIAENCQVNGVDFSELVSLNSTMEVVNNDLVTKLQEMQAETENLLRRTIEYRRHVPQIIKEAYIKETGVTLGKIEKDLEGEIELGKEDVELCNVDRGIKPNFYSNKLSSGLSHLTQLQSVKNIKINFELIKILKLINTYLHLVNSGCCGEIGTSSGCYNRRGWQKIR